MRYEAPVATSMGPIAPNVASRCWLLFAGIMALMYVVSLKPFPDVRGFNVHDPVTYLLSAESLWHGHGYTLPSQHGDVPIKLQPPGFSLLLAPAIGIFGMNFLLLKLYMVGFAGFLAIAGFAFFKEFLHDSTAARLGTLLLMGSPVIFQLSHQILAEIPLLLFTVGALWALHRYLQEPRSLWSAYLALSATSTVAAVFVKGLGLTVLAGGWLLMAHRAHRNWKTCKKLLMYTALVAIPVAVWQVHCFFLPSIGFHGRSIADFFVLQNPYMENSPTATLGDIVLRARHNISWGMAVNAAMAVAQPLYFIRESLLAFVLSAPIVGWLIWLWWRSFMLSPSVLEGLTASTLVILLLEYDGHAIRYMNFLYPAFLVYALRGLRGMASRRWARSVLFLLGGMSVGGALLVAIDQVKDPFGSPVRRDYIQVGQYVRSAWPLSSRCVVPSSGHWRIVTGHQCLEADEFMQGPLRDAGVAPDYAVMLSDASMADRRDLTGLDGTLVQGAFEAGELMRSRYPNVNVSLENGTFAVVRPQQ